MTDKPSFLVQVDAWRQRVFPERQLFLRSEGRVRFLTIPSFVQVGISLALTISLCWAIVTSVYFFLRDGELKARDMKLAEVSADYQNLSTDFSALEKDIEARTALLEERQQLLEQLLERKPIKQVAAEVALEKAALSNDSPASTERLDLDKNDSLSDQAASKDIPAPAANEQSEPASFTEFDMSAAAPSPEVLAESRTALSYAEVVLAHAAALEPAARRRSLLNRLREVEQRQRDLTNVMLTLTAESISYIDKALEPIKLTSENLIAQSDENTRAGIGGPFIPVEASTIKPVFASGDVAPLEMLLARLADHETVLNVLDHMPFGDPADDFRLSSRYGRRRDPFRRSWSYHYGVDLAGWPGNAILATADGIVVLKDYHGAYGNRVEIDHGNGFRTRFGHMRKVVVKKGQRIKKGQKIGEMGKSGRATDTHLHYEVWFDGDTQNPLPYVREAANVFKVQKRFKDSTSTTGS